MSALNNNNWTNSAGKSKTLVLLFISVAIVGVVYAGGGGGGGGNGQCPVECACLGNVVDCSGLKLIGLPSGLPPWTEILELKDNSIVNLDFEAFDTFSKLRELDVSSNNLQDNFTSVLPKFASLNSLKVNKNSLKTIPDVSALSNLTHLTVSHNEIESIDGNVLKKMKSLQSLDVANNKISFIRKSSFPAASNSLTKLNLNSNEIVDIEPGSFDTLTLLEELRINKNGLTKLVTGMFGNLTHLRILELNRNQLQQIQGLSMKNLTNLEELKLKRNKIDTLDDGAFWQLKALLVLQLDFNNLTAVKKGALFGPQRLQKLTLSRNRISTIQPAAWEACKEIRELDLSNNQLKSIDRETLEHLAKLERLKLDHNKITYIFDGAFSNTPNLKSLDLNSNKISAMLEDMTTGVTGAFIPLGKLIKLSLSQNQIKSINSNAFTGLSSLQELELLDNNITSIQENSFLPMPQLMLLNINTAALVCDCGLQWLSLWLREHRYNEAKVACGYPHWLKGMQLTELQHSNFTCEEFPKPRIIEGPTNKMGIKGSNVSLTCHASSTADTPLHFIWKHENTEIRKRIETSLIAGSGSGLTEAKSVLHLVNVSHSNAGRYQCMVSNNYGTSYSAKAKLNVLVYPSFTMIPHDIRAAAGSTARLECSAEGQPSPQIAWQKDGGNDFPAARERRMHMMPTDPVLFIVDVKTADSGIYSCTAQNLAGIITVNATLTILETPSFVKKMENKEVTAGQTVVIECMASGSPQPKILWKKNESPLVVTERVFFSAEDQLLIIVNTVPGDAGNYECEISNSLGHESGASRVTIVPAPSTIVNGDDMLGLLVIAVVCCAVGTSIIWVVIIYQTRRLNASHNNASSSSSSSALPKINSLPVTTASAGAATQMYLDSTSQHSKDSGTGDSTNPSNDQLQLCLPEEMRVCVVNPEEDESTITGEDPLLLYTNHQRHKLACH